MQVGTVKEIWRFPVKSMFGERVPVAQMERRGFADDRTWAVREEDTGEFVGGRKIPRLMLLKARYLQEPQGGFGPAANSIVEIEFPDGRRVTSDDPYASAILSMFLGKRVSLQRRPAARDKSPHRLARPMSPTEIRYALGMKPEDPAPDFSSWSLQVLGTLSRYTTPPGALYDVYPLHFLTTAALEAMRAHYPEGDFRVERYRPNFLIETDPGLTGIIENEWRGLDLRVGDALIRCNVPTIRCSMPGAAQPGIEKDPNIPRALMKYADQHLGAYATPRNTAQIRVGDVVEVVPKPSSNVYFWFDAVGRRIKSNIIKVTGHLAEWQYRKSERPARRPQSVVPKGFRPYTLVDRQQESEDITSFWFEDPARSELPRYVPGQHLVLAVPQPDGGFVYRPYSLSCGSRERGRYRISVKRETAQEDGQTQVGKGSGWLHDLSAIGDSIAIKDPGGQFADVPTDTSALILISAGIGITPFLSMLHAIAAENPGRNVKLFHGIRSAQDFAFQRELQALQQQLPNFELRVFVSQPGAEALAPPMQAGRMHLDQVPVMQALQADSHFMICGKPAFSKAMHDGLLEAGVDDARVHYESFGASQMIDHSDRSRYEVRFTDSQHTVSWDPQQESLLTFAEEQGIEVASGCRYGACQACEATLLSGEVIYPPEVQPPAGKNRVLLCSARPKSDIELAL